MAPPITLFSVNAVLLLSTDDSSRILAHYYSPPHPPQGANASGGYPGMNPYPSVKEQKAFEKGLLEKTNKSTNDVILYDNRVVVGAPRVLFAQDVPADHQDRSSRWSRTSCCTSWDLRTKTRFSYTMHYWL